MTRYRHTFDLCFTVPGCYQESPEASLSLEVPKVAAALLQRVTDILRTNDWMEACGEVDTEEEE